MWDIRPPLLVASRAAGVFFYKLMTQTQIANLALSLLGAKTIADYTTEQTQQAVEARRWFDVARDEVLAGRNWNFAADRARVTTTYTALSGSSAIANNGSGLIRVTSNSHGLSDGMRVYIKNVQGVTAANARWYVTGSTTNTFDLVDSVFSGTYTASTGQWVRIPLFAWDYWHAIPSGCLKVRRVLDEPCDDEEEKEGLPFAVESSKIMCNVETAYVRFTKQVTDVTLWPAEFITAFSTLLASYLAQALSGPSGRAGALRESFEKLMLPNAGGVDAREGRGTRRAMQHTESKMVSSRY